MGKSTKAPVMKPNQQYQDWKKELRIWEATNVALGVDAKIQAGILFESLDGTARQTVLSELSVEEITCNDGVKNIMKTLDFFFSGNETQNSYNVIDDLLKFKCEPKMSIESFIIDFQLKVNRVKASGTVLSDTILGYALLNAANLPHDKHDMVKATCDILTFNKVKAQLEKIGLRKSSKNEDKFTLSRDAGTSKVNVEQCFCGNVLDKSAYRDHESTDDSSDEGINGGKVFYSGNQRRNDETFSKYKKHKMNPTDKFGHVRACAYCKCHYHWLMDCPYAPASIKNEITNKYKRNNNPSL